METGHAERARTLRERRAQVDAEEVTFLVELAAGDDWWSLAEELAPELRASPTAVRERCTADAERPNGNGGAPRSGRGDRTDPRWGFHYDPVQGTSTVTTA